MPRRGPIVRDTSIRTYKARRDFDSTSEPKPAKRKPGKAPLFVVQKHDATRLHWDFRLEHDGVLLSWAVPRGPSLDPHDKRLAVHVEDHPVAYADFAGTIPAGEYGAGRVEIWDRGTWEPVGNPDEAMRKGDFKFTLRGERLNGRFVLVRMKPRPNDHAENWLLIKERDGLERDGADAAALEADAAPKSPAIHLTHPDRVLWPGITKGDLAAYWDTIAAHALPDIAHRPLALLRCPDGIDGEHFFQKHRSKGMPDAIREGEAVGQPYIAIDDGDGLRACVQFAAIELHCWGSTEDDPAHADRLVFDLDPGDGVGMDALVRAARDVRDRLGKLGLDSFPRTSGGKGLHVVAPLAPHVPWDRVRAWCQDFAKRMEADHPDRFVSTIPKDKRRGKILIDWLRNGVGSTAIASYSPRARPGALVATPLAWREVTARLDPSAHTIATIPARLARRKRDPWENFATLAQTLPKEA